MLTLTALPEEILVSIAEDCALQQHEEDAFYEHPCYLPAPRSLVSCTNHGVEALSLTSAVVRRISVPILFRQVSLHLGGYPAHGVEKALEHLYSVLMTERRQYLAGYVQHLFTQVESNST
jgi:hypothetical protein